MQTVVVVVCSGDLARAASTPTAGAQEPQARSWGKNKARASPYVSVTHPITMMQKSNPSLTRSLFQVLCARPRIFRDFVSTLKNKFSRAGQSYRGIHRLEVFYSYSIFRSPRPRPRVGRPLLEDDDALPPDMPAQDKLYIASIVLSALLSPFRLFFCLLGFCAFYSSLSRQAVGERITTSPRELCFLSNSAPRVR